MSKSYETALLLDVEMSEEDGMDQGNSERVQCVLMGFNDVSFQGRVKGVNQ